MSVVLIAITWLVFGQTLRHDFVNFDDHVYVYENPRITQGLTVDGIIGAFTHAHARNWHPLTTISHMLDCQLYGLKAGGHHFTNLLLHSITVVLLFLLLSQITAAFWKSAFAASLFAIHPLHVESVAWISERKDVLSALFFILTLFAYAYYVRAPSVRRYFVVAFLFALGLMSKPMLVTLPFVLLLLDYWPLGRNTSQIPGVRNEGSRTSGRWPGLAVEKIPLFGLSVLSCVATFAIQCYSEGATAELPLAWRLNNAAVTYVIYIWQMFWPARLAAFYPLPDDQLPLWQVLLASAFLVSVSALAINGRKKRPYIFTGWFWYVGMLVPVIGVVQAGEQARADRYTYLPQIGLYLLITWGIADMTARVTTRTFRSEVVVRGSPAVRTDALQGLGYRLFRTATAAAIIIALSWRAFVQTSYWKNSETLWKHTLAITTGNDTAHNSLGNLYLGRGEWDSAISQFQAASDIRSRHTAAHYNLGGALIENNLATALARKGLLDEAITHYEKAVKLRPEYGDPYLNLGSLLFQQGRVSDAIAQWHKALATQPNDADFHITVGNVFVDAGLQKDAIAEYEHAAQISPQGALAQKSLAWLLATSSDASIRDGNRAIKIAEQAAQLSGGKDPDYLRTLAAACAESGQFAEAKQTAQQALQAAEVQGNSNLANALRDEIALYELGLPYHKTRAR